MTIAHSSLMKMMTFWEGTGDEACGGDGGGVNSRVLGV